MPNAVAEVAEAVEAAEVAEAAGVVEVAAAVSRRDRAASVKRLVFSQNISPARAAGLSFTSAGNDGASGRASRHRNSRTRPPTGRPSSCSPTDDIPDLLTPPRAARPFSV